MQSPRDDRPCRLIDWKPWPFENPSLIGHCSVAFAGGWVVHQIRSCAARMAWASACRTPRKIDSEGRIKVRDGKKQYTSVLTFETAEGRERWRRMGAFRPRSRR